MPLMNGSAAALAEVTPRRVRARTVLVVLAVLFGAGIYSYVVDIYDPNKNLLSQIWRGIRQHQYIFYSALPGFKWAKEPDRVSHSGSRWR